MNDPMKVFGQCFCGLLQFELILPTDMCSHCHCESCRKTHGAAFVTWTGVPRNRFNFLAGEDHLKRFKSSSAVHWGFCLNCGTSFMYEHDLHPDRIWVTVGSLTGKMDRLPDGHMSFEERVDWCQVSDGLPRYLGKSDQEI
jgi:hypothetical protein